MIEWIRHALKRLLCWAFDHTWETVPGMGIEGCTCCGDLRTFCHRAACPVKVSR